MGILTRKSNLPEPKLHVVADGPAEIGGKYQTYYQGMQELGEIERTEWGWIADGYHFRRVQDAARYLAALKGIDTEPAPIHKRPQRSRNLRDRQLAELARKTNSPSLNKLEPAQASLELPPPPALDVRRELEKQRELQKLAEKMGGRVIRRPSSPTSQH